MPDSETPASTAIDALAEAWAGVKEAIASIDDPTEAFDAATQVTKEVLPSMVKDGGDLRAATATRIWEADGLSLKGLAERTGVNKNAADRWVRRGRALAAREQEEGTE